MRKNKMDPWMCVNKCSEFNGKYVYGITAIKDYSLDVKSVKKLCEKCF